MSWLGNTAGMDYVQRHSWQSAALGALFMLYPLSFAKQVVAVVGGGSIVDKLGMWS